MKKSNKILLIISVALCLISIIFAGALQTNWGKVEMSELSIESEYGTLTGYIFRPKTATSSSKAPCVICNHGYLNNREMQDEVYIELSRRGYVVISMESFGHGDSDVEADNDGTSALSRTRGMTAFVEYAYGLDFVDQNKIGVTGHSMGGAYSSITMDYYSNETVNKINTGVIVGNYPTVLFDKDDNAHAFKCNTGVILAQYDEFFYANGVNMLSTDNTKKVVEAFHGSSVDNISEGEYISSADGNYKLTFYNPKQFHATNHFSTEVTSYIVKIFQDNMSAGHDINPTNQVWLLKEIFNLVGLVGFFLFVIPFLDLLLQLPFFKSVKKEVVLYDAPLNKKVYIRNNILSGLWCALLIIPAVGIGMLLTMAVPNPIFPQDTTLGVALWCVVCGLVVFGYQKKAFGKKLKGNMEEYGAKLGVADFFKTLLLASLVVIGTYSLLFMADGINQTDFRFWTFDIRVFNFSKVLVAIRYMPLFAVFYIFSGFACAKSSFKNWSETKQILIMVAFNIIAPALYLFIVYTPTIWMQTIVWASTGLGAALALVSVIMIPFVPILAISSVISVKAYRLSGNMWLGGLINTILITMITVATTSFCFPYMI